MEWNHIENNGNGTLVQRAHHTQVAPTFIVSLKQQHWDTVGR